MKGDFHRFGQCVRKSYEPKRGKNWFLKPRSGALEFLFFDQTSPVNSFLDEINPQRPKFEVSCISPWLSEAEDISKLTINPIKPFNVVMGRPGFIKSYAYWSLLALLFGLTDLHCGNILIVSNDSETCLQPIDLETAFESVTNLSETGLLDHPYHTKSLSGFFGQWGMQSDENLNLSFPIVEFLDLFITLFEKLISTSWTSAVLTAWQFLEDQPIRRIIKPTDVYRKALKNSTEALTFFDEEKWQMRAADIPYFFHYHPKEDIFYFQSPDRIEVVSHTFRAKRKMTTDEACSTARIEQLMKVACLQILRRHFSGSSVLAGRKFSAQLTGDTLQLDTFYFSVSTARSHRAPV